MKKRYDHLFIDEGYSELQREYAEVLRGGSHEIWDYVAITASSEAQAKRYEEELEYRLRHGLIPEKTKYIVVPDPMGKRVGSGGACLNVLREIALREMENGAVRERVFKGLRILCIHSGGDSKRVPQYSVCGKLFAPMPRRQHNGLASALFDEIMLSACAFPPKMTDGMMTCSGDVLLLLDPQEMEYFHGGAQAISIKTDVNIGCNHGVYLSDGEGRVKRFLHKQSADKLCSSGAVDENGQVDIDTGAVIFGSDVLGRLYSLVDTEESFRAVVNDRVRLSFYADFSYPLSTEATLEEYLLEKPEGEFTPELEKYRRRIWELISYADMRLTVFSHAEFLHFGTTAELRSLMTEKLHLYSSVSRSRFINTDILFPERAEENVAVCGGVISSGAVIHRGTHIEDSYIGNAEIGEGCVISCSVIPDGAVIPRDTVISTVRTSAGYVARLYSVFDDPKERFHLGKPIDEPLWSAKLFPLRDTPENAALASIAAYCGEGYDSAEELWSLESSFSGACNDGMMKHREEMLLDNAKRSFLGLAERKAPFSDVEGIYSDLDEDARERVKKALADYAREKQSDISEFGLTNMRMNAYAYAITNDGEFLDAAFEQLKGSVAAEASRGLYGLKPIRNESSVSLPVRVNFAGGWTDTPPYCMENGGAVLNAAVILDDLLPITARARIISERKLVFISEEIGERAEIGADDISALFKSRQGTEPFSIHKAALYESGLLIDGDGKGLFDALGGGLELFTAVRGIPKGSGLGTSSILCGALLSALYGLFGVQPEDVELWQKVLLMEQYMGVGGGWQDQIGGMIPGIKLITSQLGAVQKPEVTALAVPKKALHELEERFALIYTGQRREARNILRSVALRYMLGEDGVDTALSGMKTLARDMSVMLENGDIDGFGEMLSRACEYTVSLYSGCSNRCIEEIFSAVNDLICGKMICGAGGGGFLQVILKKGATLDMLNRRLRECFGECEIKAQKCRFAVIKF